MRIERNLGPNLRRQPEQEILRTIDSAGHPCHRLQGNYSRDVELLFRNTCIDFALKGIMVELDLSKLLILRVKPYLADLDPQSPSIIKVY